MDGLEVRRVAAVDPATFPTGFDVDVSPAAISSLSSGTVVVDDVTTAELGLHPGDAVWWPSPAASRCARRWRRWTPTAGALENARLVVDRRLSPRHGAQLGGPASAPGVDLWPSPPPTPSNWPRCARPVEGVVAGSPQIDVRDQQELRADTRRQLDAVLTLVNVLLGMSVLIALLGVANTVGLTVYERTREIGLLRAVGMGRQQVRSMVRWEAISVSTIGAVLGVVVGCVLGGAAVRSLADEGFRELSIPGLQLVAYVGLAAVAGAAAGWLPARRAASVPVVEALGEVD
jgi:putative ABC transport system permease protein